MGGKVGGFVLRKMIHSIRGKYLLGRYCAQRDMKGKGKDAFHGRGNGRGGERGQESRGARGRGGGRAEVGKREGVRRWRGHAHAHAHTHTHAHAQTHTHC